MADLTDKELPGYLLIHCTTPVGRVHKRHLARLHTLAGLHEEASQISNGEREWYRPSVEWIRELCQSIPGWE